MKANTMDAVIIKVGYYSAENALIVRFNHNVIRGYDTLYFENVDIQTVKDFKNAENREQFFEDNIRHNFKYCATWYEKYEIFCTRQKRKSYSSEEVQAKIQELRDKFKTITETDF